MATVNGIISFTPGERIYAAQHNANWTTISTFCNDLSSGVNIADEAISSDNLAPAAVTGPKIAANAVTSDKLASNVLNGLTPSGAIMQYAGTAAPTGWLLCDGSNVNRSTYSDLFAVVGTTYGSGDGSTTFGLPNLKGRIPVGLDAAQTEFNALGETGGFKTHTLTIGEMPSHTHIQNGHNHTMAHTHSVTHDHPSVTSTSDTHRHTVEALNAAGNHNHTLGFTGDLSAAPIDFDSPQDSGTITTAVNNDTHNHSVDIPSITVTSGGASTTSTTTETATNQNTGGGDPHNNLQPYIVVNYIIKV